MANKPWSGQQGPVADYRNTSALKAEFPVGSRVQLHAATDDWMRGDRYGEVTGYGKEREYIEKGTGAKYRQRPVLVKLDKSGKVKRFHPTNLFAIERENPRKRNPRGTKVRVTIHGMNKFEVANALASARIPFLFRSETFAPVGLGGTAKAREYLSTTGDIPADWMPEFQRWRIQNTDVRVTFHPIKNPRGRYWSGPMGTYPYHQKRALTIAEAQKLIRDVGHPQLAEQFGKQVANRHTMVTALHKTLKNDPTYKPLADEIAVMLRSAIDSIKPRENPRKRRAKNPASDYVIVLTRANRRFWYDANTNRFVSSFKQASLYRTKTAAENRAFFLLDKYPHLLSKKAYRITVESVDAGGTRMRRGKHAGPDRRKRARNPARKK